MSLLKYANNKIADTDTNALRGEERRWHRRTGVHTVQIRPGFGCSVEDQHKLEKGYKQEKKDKPKMM